jgi:hypothetical protein
MEKKIECVMWNAASERASEQSDGWEDDGVDRKEKTDKIRCRKWPCGDQNQFVCLFSPSEEKRRWSL